MNFLILKSTKKNYSIIFRKSANTDILHLIVFFGDDAYTFTANGNIEVLAVEAGTKAKMLRFILSSPVK